MPDLDYRAIGLAPHAEDILIFFIDLFEYGVLDPANQRLLAYLSDGYSTREIATELGQSERTTNRRIATLRRVLTDYALAPN